MKKSRILACCIASCAVAGMFAFAACGGETTPSGEGTAMTEEDVTKVSTAMQTMSDYQGGYTIKENVSLDYTVDGYSIYDSKLTMDSYVTFDAASKTTGYSTSMTGTNLYSGSDYEAAYYTVANENGYTQYLKYVDSTNSLYTSTDYTMDEVDQMMLFYSDFSSCMEDILGINLTQGGSITSAEDMATFWQGLVKDSVDLLASAYGFVITFNYGDSTVITDGGSTVYSFDAYAAASVTLNGYDYTDDVTYKVNVYLDTTDADSIKLSKIQTEVSQVIKTTQSGQTLVMRANSTSADEFIYAYDSSLIPTDFSIYTNENSSSGNLT